MVRGLSLIYPLGGRLLAVNEFLRPSIMLMGLLTDTKLGLLFKAVGRRLALSTLRLLLQWLR